MVKQKILNLLRNHKKSSLIIGVLLIVLLFGIYIQSITPTNSIPTTSTPVIPSPITINNEPKSAQTLHISWSNPDYEAPTELPVYRNAKVFYTKSEITTISKNLGFTDDNKINTGSLNSMLWVSGNKSLSVNLPYGPLTFTDSTDPSASGFTNLNAAKTKAQTLVNQILPIDPAIKFEIAANHKFFLKEVDSLYMKEVSADKAHFINLYASQIVNNLPYISPQTTGNPVTLNLNSSLNLVYLETFGPAVSLSQPSISKITPYKDMQNFAEKSATRIPVTQRIGSDAEIDKLADVFLNVTKVDMVYVSTPSKKYIQPAYRLQGTVSGDGIAMQQALYIVPATQN